MKIYKIVHRDENDRQLSGLIAFDDTESLNNILSAIESGYDSVVEEAKFLGKNEGLYIPFTRGGATYPAFIIK